MCYLKNLDNGLCLVFGGGNIELVGFQYTIYCIYDFTQPSISFFIHKVIKIEPTSLVVVSMKLITT